MFPVYHSPVLAPNVGRASPRTLQVIHTASRRMDFRGNNQRMRFRGGILQLPRDELEAVLAAVVKLAGRQAAGRLRQTCQFFGRLGGRYTMDSSCQILIANCAGCTQHETQVHRLPATEDWLRTAAVLLRTAAVLRATTDGPTGGPQAAVALSPQAVVALSLALGHDRAELLLLQAMRYQEWRRAAQELPWGDTSLGTHVATLAARLEALRNQHGRHAVTVALLKADVRETNTLLGQYGFVAAFAETEQKLEVDFLVPGMTGTLHDNAQYAIKASFGVPATAGYAGYPDCDPHENSQLMCKIRQAESAPQAFHPNIYPSGKLCGFGGVRGTRGTWYAWDKTFSLTELVLQIYGGLHLMNIDDPAQRDPYLQAKNDRPTFRRSVRTAALAASASRSVHPGWIHPSRRVPCTPTALRLAVLVAAPPGTQDHNKDFRHFSLDDRVHRLHWPAGGRWPAFTWPDDVKDGNLVDPEPTHMGWM